MGIKEQFDIRPIDYEDCKEWFLYKHYAHRIPSVSYCFGLYRDGILEGVCSFGHPMAMPLIKGAFGGEYQDCFYELNRLCVNDGLQRNVLSHFVGTCLKMLPKPMVIVSYADSSRNHHGYIYQATNWIYTGLSSPFMDYMVRGYEDMHGASIMDMVGRSDGKNGHIDKVKALKEKFGAENVYQVERARKHRYFYLLGSKTERRRMSQRLTYRSLPYPKGENVRYDASYEVHPQGVLF